MCGRIIHRYVAFLRRESECGVGGSVECLMMVEFEKISGKGRTTKELDVERRVGC